MLQSPLENLTHSIQVLYFKISNSGGFVFEYCSRSRLAMTIKWISITDSGEGFANAVSGPRKKGRTPSG